MIGASQVVLSDFSTEPSALLVPAERQLANALQVLGREMGRLRPVEDALDDLGREEGELQRSRDVGDVGTFALSEIADGELPIA